MKRKSKSPAANLLAVSKKATGQSYSVLNPRSSTTGILRLSKFSILTYRPASIARITQSMFSSAPWISMVTLPSHSFLTQPVAVQFCGMAGTIAEADALYPAKEGDVFADHIHYLATPGIN